MILLALECSAYLSSVAVWKDSKVLSHQIVEAKFGHAERIIIQVEKAIKQANIDLSQIDLFVGGRGPGSFTGIRTCLSAITGFSIALNKASYGVNGLSASGLDLYLKLKERNNYNGKTRIFAISDTRRGSFYFQEFNEEYTKSNNTYDFSLEQLRNKISSEVKSGSLINICGPFSKNFWENNIITSANCQVKYDKVNLDATHIASYVAWQMKNDKPVSPATPLYLAPAKISNSKISVSGRKNKKIDD